MTESVFSEGIFHDILIVHAIVFSNPIVTIYGHPTVYQLTPVQRETRSIVKFELCCRGHLQISQSSSDPLTIYPNQLESHRKYFNPSINPKR